MSTRGSISVVCLIMLVGLRTAAAEEAKIFRYRFANDDRFIYRMTIEAKQTQSFGNTKLEATITNTDVSIRTLERIDADGNFVIRSLNKLFQAHAVAGPHGEFTYDSRSSTNEGMMTPVFDRLKGAAVRITISPHGRVRTVEGLTDRLKDVVKAHPELAELGTRASDEFAVLTYSEAFIPFPDKPLRPGDTWEVPLEWIVPRMGTFKRKTTYRYEGPDRTGDRATEKFTEKTDLTIIPASEGPGAPTGGMLTTTRSSGVAHFDPNIGQVVSKRSTTTVSGTITVDAQKNVSLQQEQTNTIILELLDEVPE